MAEDSNTPQHLKLGALKQLVALMGVGDSAAKKDGPVVVMPKRADGLPPDPLLDEFPEVLTDDDGRAVPADPYADLDWAGVVGRAPHALYARVLHTCPWHPTDLGKRGRSSNEAKTLIDAEQRFLRACRDRGLDTEADEVADVRRRRRRARGNS
jgi:hypothetical protein